VLDLVGGGHSIAEFTTHTDTWDGSWTLIVFSMPEEQSMQRRTLRERLRWWGYAPLYDGAWVSPHPLPRDLRAELAAVSLGALTVFHAQHLELESMVARSPVDAWDIAGVAREYESFIRKWSRLVSRITAERVTGARAVRARTEVMDTYRRFPVLDPLLPIKLLPSGWPRARAREVFVAVYDGLAKPAQEHVRAVVAHVADGLDPGIQTGIQTHTVADMDAGVTEAG
jgi:phenylacetic acid degradation operon negative regulatory protein